MAARLTDTNNPGSLPILNQALQDIDNLKSQVAALQQESVFHKTLSGGNVFAGSLALTENILLQFGSTNATVPATGSKTILFPRSFSAVPYVVLVGVPYFGSQSTTSNLSHGVPTATSFVIYNGGATATSADWLAIGPARS